MESLAGFQELMGRMLSPENESRSAAEKQYEAIPVPQRASLLFLLFQQQNADVEVLPLHSLHFFSSPFIVRNV